MPCFKASHFTRGKDGAPSELAPPLSADADKGDQDTLVYTDGSDCHEMTFSMPDAPPPTGIRYGSLCSGIEAATVAWHGLGWEPAWFSQFDPDHSYKSGPDFASAVLAHHYPDVPNLGDMTAADWAEKAAALGDIDVLVGGTPCQDFSIAGLRQGLDGDRGQLSLRFCEIANAADPSVILWENVPGVLSDHTNGFGCLLAGLAGEDVPLQPPGGKWTDAGIVFGPQRTIAWRVVCAQHFGVAQRRRRVFVVACPTASGLHPEEILFEFDGVRRDSAPSREAGEGAAAGPDGGAAGAGTFSRGHYERDAGVGGALTDELAAAVNALQPTGVTGLTEWDSQSGRCYSEDGVAPTLQGTGSHGGKRVPALLQGVDIRNGSITGDVAMTVQAGHSPDPGGTPHVLQVVVPIMDPSRRSSGGGKDLNRAGTGIGAEGDPSFTLGAERPHGVACYGEDLSAADGVSVTENQRAEVTEQLQANACTKGGGKPGQGYAAARRAGCVRRLTPTECCRLQGFPDGYTLIPWKNKPADACPDGPRYRALGNSMAVPCMAFIGRRIHKALMARKAGAP